MEFGRACEENDGITTFQPLIDPRQDTAERTFRRVKTVRQHFSFCQDSMQVVVSFYEMLLLLAKRPKPLGRWEYAICKTIVHPKILPKIQKVQEHYAQEISDMR